MLMIKQLFVPVVIDTITITCDRDLAMNLAKAGISEWVTLHNAKFTKNQIR